MIDRSHFRNRIRITLPALDRAVEEKIVEVGRQLGAIAKLMDPGFQKWR